MYLLSLNTLLASTNAAKALLQVTAGAPASSVAASDTRGFSIEGFRWNHARCLGIAYALAVRPTCRHLDTAVTKRLAILEGLLDSERRFTLAFEVIWLVLLDNVSCKS